MPAIVFANIKVDHFRADDNQKVYHLELMILYARIMKQNI
jgi:hypothetical protein